MMGQLGLDDLADRGDASANVLELALEVALLVLGASGVSGVAKRPLDTRR
jgi:hypothetical protein